MEKLSKNKFQKSDYSEARRVPVRSGLKKKKKALFKVKPEMKLENAV